MKNKKPPKINHLKLVRSADEAGGLSPEQRTPPTGTIEPENLAEDALAIAARRVWDAAVAEFNTPMWETRDRLAAIDDIEELAKEFYERELWVYGVLHDELRRARSGDGYYSRLVTRRSDDEFMTGYALSLAYEGDGPLSTPIEEWDEEDNGTIILCEQLRADSIELSCCISFMMH